MIEGYTVVIICCGKVGKMVYDVLRESNVQIECFFDNDESNVGHQFQGIAVEKPCNKGKKYKYIIANSNSDVREELRNQLIALGIPKDSILEMSKEDEWEYWKNLPEDQYKNEISQLYFETFGCAMNWSSPSKYNEIINFEKLYADDNEKKRILADKYSAREYVSKIIGDEHLVKYLGVWDAPEKIDFSILPESFVLKTNNGSGRNILVKDKNEIDEVQVREQLKKWMEMDYAYYGLALHYKGIKPMIICEEYLDGLAETVYDYDVFCFHGKPQYIWCISGSHRKWAKASFYDFNWQRIDNVSYGYPYDPVLAPRPKELEKIRDFSEMLSKGFKHCRVDWYIMPDGRVLFSEITFATWGGLRRFIPEEWDERFGKLITDDQSFN